jgi:hypothetical protein
LEVASRGSYRQIVSGVSPKRDSSPKGIFDALRVTRSQQGKWLEIDLHQQLISS